ncbi:MAG: peptidoglycan-binding protein [Parcubacteria group bacterium]|nr:peptidoglycan-binding protein [Parcubacteria group bacterium]
MKKALYFFILFSFFVFLFSGPVRADFLNQTALFSINPEYQYSSQSSVSATLKKISDKAYWYVSDDYWRELSESQKNTFLQKMDELAVEFDTRIYPVETVFWGSEWNPGIDNDSRVTVLITKLIDRAGGYFDTSHEYSKSQVPESNEREMVFINAISLFNGRAKIFLAHEFQHLIAFEQKERLRNAEDDVWLNELRSEHSVRLLGYDDNFDNSNLERRLYAFSQSPSEPLAEWKNLGSDYGIITLFSYYLTDHYGEKILSDSLKSVKVGIESINEALSLNGFFKTFSDIFSNWTIAGILNDQSAGPEFAYKSGHLVNSRISPTQTYGISGVSTVVPISNSVKDWQPVWYEFNTPVSSGGGLNLKIDFSADSGTNFKVPYVAYKVNGQKEIGFIPIIGSTGVFFLKNFGTEAYKVVLIPANHSKTSGFTEDDSASSFEIKVQLTAEFQEAAPAPAFEPPSVALSIQDLLGQITALQSQITKLRQKTVAQGAPQPAVGILTRNLYVGSAGDDVRWLQDFLFKEGVYPEARITGYFGSLTRSAVIQFQQKYGIFPQIGYVGAKTRVKIEELAQ